MIRLIRPPCPDLVALQTTYKAPINKQALVKAGSGKCMYCESLVTHVYFGDVEHIRPKDLFPGLKFEWANLGYVCAKCNNAKRNKWFEETPFVDPYSEDPGETIAAIGQWLFARPGADRGRVTIHEIQLNRPELLERRLEKLNRIQEILDLLAKAPNDAVRNALGSRIEVELGDGAEYLLVGRAAYQHLAGVPK